METCFCWVSLWMVNVLFRIVSAEPASPPHYTIHRTQVSFDQAMEECSPGVVTTLATEHEVNNILGLIYKSVSPLNQNKFTFWIGLRKVKNECVDPMLPLRGFKWTEDGSNESQVSRWIEEPKDTCTTILCAVLQGELNESRPTVWGLVPVSCKKSYHFICKLREPLTGTLKPYKPATTQVESTTPEPKPVECWSLVQVEIRCLGRPAVWRLLDNSPANFTTICDPCEDGFQKESSGECVDIDECGGSPAPCRSTCLNTAGSYRCTCSDETGNHHDEDSLLCTDTTITGDNSLLSGVLFPVLVAVAALVVLMVLVAVIVKCSLMRRAKKKEEKMAMKTKDNKNSFETANEKVAI
uniref:C-type lectin domain-containing protein n=1 Tax=Mola mola TaxID=94237 RepID=A0A3Q4BX62_MOLML